MKKAGKIVEDALKLAEESVAEGLTTMALDKIVDNYIVSCGAIPSCKNYRGYPKATCISVNEVVVHGIPSTKRLKEGDIVSVDVTASLDGYNADAARTFAVGKISDEAARLIAVTRQSFFDGVAHAKVGNRLQDISAAIQKTVEKNGFSVIRAFIGHGIGQEMHEAPDVPNFGTPGRGVRLLAGMCLAIEPMVCAGAYPVQVQGDGWTAVTKDKSLAAHYENTVAITDNGPEILTLSS